MRYLNALALLLVIVGAVNWLLVGIAKFDLVAAITGSSFGQTNTMSSVIYILVGVCRRCCSCRCSPAGPPPANTTRPLRPNPPKGTLGCERS